MSWELHPPIEVDKGTAVLDLADDFAAVAFAGDDVGDLPGFDALDELADRGVATLRIAVDSPEAPARAAGRGPTSSSTAPRASSPSSNPWPDLVPAGGQSAAARLSASQSAGLRAVDRCRQRADSA